MTNLNETFRCNTCGNFIQVLKSGAGELVCCGQTMELIENKQVNQFTAEDAQKVAQAIGVNFEKEDFNLTDFTQGMNIELEHGLCDSETNVTNDNPIVTGKIALAHLNEFGDYYTRLEIMEKEAEGKM
jgi:desulfoferrodoxin-like iron-binding protein